MDLTQKTIQTIQKVAKNVAPKYTFGYYDRDDIEQEAFILALDGLKHFDPEISSLENFLYTHINNRLKNFLRKNYVRLSYECKHCNNEDPECEYCERRRWRFASKKHLMDPIDIDKINSDREKNMSVNYNFLDKMELDEIFSIINQHLDIHLRVDYLKMLEGVYVPKHKRELIESIIINILAEGGYEYECKRENKNDK